MPLIFDELWYQQYWVGYVISVIFPQTAYIIFQIYISFTHAQMLIEGHNFTRTYDIIYLSIKCVLVHPILLQTIFCVYVCVHVVNGYCIPFPRWLYSSPYNSIAKWLIASVICCAILAFFLYAWNIVEISATQVNLKQNQLEWYYYRYKKPHQTTTPHWGWLHFRQSGAT